MDDKKLKRGPARLDLSENAVNPLPSEDGGVYPQTGDPVMDFPYVINKSCHEVEKRK